MIGDYVLQGEFLSRAKCKDFWYKLYYNKERDEYYPKYKKYLNDWIAALLCHSFIWSMCIHIPIILFSAYDSSTLFSSIIINFIVHAIIDHLKANKEMINLNQDQLFHIIQIFITRIIFFSA